MNKKGKVFVVSAPSGAGKSSLCSYLVKECPFISLSVSYTTRQPRKGEENGKDYFFTDEKKFKESIEKDDFVEWAEVHGNYYGTSREYLVESAENGSDILLEIDVQGAAQIKEKIPEAVLIFILPPSIEELKNRLEKRGTDSEEVIQRRLEAVDFEMSKADMFDHKIVNDDFNKAAEDLVALIKSCVNNIKEKLNG